jgi:hypothetical protein
MASSKRRKPCRCSSSSAKAITPVRKPAGKRGTPKRRLRPRAAPMNSAMSVAIAIASA